jgi:hypothetical protein
MKVGENDEVKGINERENKELRGSTKAKSSSFKKRIK